MMQFNSDTALKYFEHLKGMLDYDLDDDLLTIIMMSSEDARLRFAHVLLAEVLARTDIPDDVLIYWLYAVVDPNQSMLPYAIVSNEVSASLRTAILTQYFQVFESIFPAKCSRLGLDAHELGQNRWDLLCYMWWELLPRYGDYFTSSFFDIDLEFLELMGRILEIGHVACKQSALRGLSLWHGSHPEIVKRIIDERRADIPDELIDHARLAQFGSLR
jgi:hypothetical protein